MFVFAWLRLRSQWGRSNESGTLAPCTDVIVMCRKWVDPLLALNQVAIGETPACVTADMMKSADVHGKKEHGSGKDDEKKCGTGGAAPTEERDSQHSTGTILQ